MSPFLRLQNLSVHWRAGTMKKKARKNMPKPGISISQLDKALAFSWS